VNASLYSTPASATVADDDVADGSRARVPPGCRRYRYAYSLSAAGIINLINKSKSKVRLYYSALKSLA